MPLAKPVKKLLKKSSAAPAAAAPATPKKSLATPKPKPVAAPKAEKKAKAPKPERVKLSGEGYNFLTGRLRRVAAEYFSDGDKAKRSELVSALRTDLTLKSIQTRLDLDDAAFLKFLNEDFFVPAAKE